MRRLAALLLAAACGGKAAEPPTQPVAPPPIVAARPSADLALDCLLQRDLPPQAALDALATMAPVEAARRAVLRWIELASEDGETPRTDAVRFSLPWLIWADDVPGLRAVLAMEDAIPEADRMSESAPARARAGMEMPDRMRDWERLPVARELAVAGDIDGAKALLAQVKQPKLAERPAITNYVEALVAVGRVDDARAIISQAAPSDRLTLIAGWLDSALRIGSGVPDAVNALVTELPIAPQTASFAALLLLRKAERLGRLGELGPLFPVLATWYQKLTPSEPALAARWEVARMAGDQPAMALLAQEPALHHFVTVRTAPIKAAITEAFTSKYPNGDLALIWSRTLTGPPADRTAFITAVCPDGGRSLPPATPPAERTKVAASEVDRGMQEECELHDVAITLTGGEPDTEVLSGQCTGACTPDEKQAGAEEVARIEAAIDAGESSNSELDYNFTDCQWSGPSVARTERVGGRDIVLLEDTFIGPHDIDGTQHQLALEVCGELFLSAPFGRMYMGSFDATELTVRESPDHQQLIVSASTDYFDGVLYRLRLPACPAKPIESVTEVQR